MELPALKRDAIIGTNRSEPAVGETTEWFLIKMRFDRIENLDQRDLKAEAEAEAPNMAGDIKNANSITRREIATGTIGIGRGIGTTAETGTGTNQTEIRTGREISAKAETTTCTGRGQGQGGIDWEDRVVVVQAQLRLPMM